MAKTYVAALAGTEDVTDGTWCDVSVIETDGNGDLTDKTAAAVRLPVRVDDADKWDKAERAVPDALAAFGWGITGDWEYGDNAAYAEAVPLAAADDRTTSEGRSTPARLSRWVTRNVPDRRVREDGEDVVLLTGGELYDLLSQVADWAYHTGTDDVAQHGQHVAEFFGEADPGRG